MKVCAKAVWASENLEGRVVAMQGFGHVATYTASHLLEEGAEIVAADISEDAVDRAHGAGARVAGVDEIYDTGCDIFAPVPSGERSTARVFPGFDVPS